MDVSVMVYSFDRLLSTGETTVPAIISYLRELGVDAVELRDEYISDETLPSIQSALADAGSRVGCYDVQGDFATTESAERAAAIARVRRGFERASLFGSRLVLLTPGSPPTGMSPDVARRCYAEGIKACLADAKRFGLTVTIENLGSQALVCGTSEHLNAICDAVGPELKITYDAGNFLLADEDLLQALDRVRSRVVYVHLKDWRVVPARPSRLAGEYLGLDGRGFTGAALGEGVVDLTGAIGRLRAKGYDGVVSVEYEGTSDPREAVKRGVEYARGLLD